MTLNLICVSISMLEDCLCEVSFSRWISNYSLLTLDVQYYHNIEITELIQKYEIYLSLNNFASCLCMYVTGTENEYNRIMKEKHHQESIADEENRWVDYYTMIDDVCICCCCCWDSMPFGNSVLISTERFMNK